MRPRKILQLARWEALKGRGVAKKETVLIAAVMVAITLGVFQVASVGVTGTGAANQGLYTIGVDTSSPYYPAIDQHPALTPVAPSDAAFTSGDIDAVVSEGHLRVQDTKKGRAAASTVTVAIRQYNDHRMANASNQSQAFPVTVTVTYLPQGPANTTSSSSPNQTAAADPTPENTTNRTVPQIGQQSAGESMFQQPAGSTLVPPSNLQPPFPFESLLLAFIFILPLNFIMQLYASSMMNERLQRRGELLLATPITRGEIIAGKTLPYLVVAATVCTAITLAIGGGVLTLLGVLPLLAAFLAVGFVGAMFARSYKELTFVTLGGSVALTAYAFLPAVFTSVHPVAAISPLYVVVADLTGLAVSLPRILLSTTPILFTGLLLFLFGLGVYEPDSLFKQQPLPAKFLSAVAAHLTSRWRLILLGGAVIPFVFAAELIVLAVLVVFPTTHSVLLLLGLIALIEEVAKSLPVYAGFQRQVFDRTIAAAIIAGGLSGVGFFLTEKVTVILQSAGLTELALGEAVVQTVSTGATGGTLLGVIVLVLWPFLHSLTTAVSALGARYGRWQYYGMLLVATGLHVAYNYAAVMTHG